MINVNQITAQLARMPDQALQQYAAMHKEDPYTVSLALAESNRRKQMRTASQGAQGEAPKVVDQELAQMAAPTHAMPEDVGIGALPANNMQHMADGGIVGYADGGRPLAAMQGGASVPFGGYGGGPSMIPAKTGYEGMGIMEFLQAFGSDVLANLPSEAKEQLKANEARKAASFEAERDRNMASLATPGASPTDPNFRRLPDPRVAGLTTTPPEAGPRADPAAPPADTGSGIGQPSAPGGARSFGGASGAAPIKDFLTQQQALEARLGPAVDKFADKRIANTEADVAARKEGIATLKSDQESDLKNMFTGAEERLGKREADLGKDKGRNEGIALLEAGLAMMQSTGRGLSGIAQGAGVGLKSYTAGIDKIKAGQEKIDDARNRMDELRQNQVSMNKRDVRAEERGIREVESQGRRDLLQGAEQAGIKQQALTIGAAASDIATQNSAAQRRSAENIAAAQAHRALLSDERAETRARLTAAADLAKNAQLTLKSMDASDDEKAMARKDLLAANGVMRDLGAMTDISSQAKADVAKYLNPGKPTR